MSTRALIGSALAVGLALPLVAPAVSATATSRTSSPATRAAAQLQHSRESAPSGWSIDNGSTKTRLTWRSTARVPVGDAAVEFWLGPDVLGTPKPGVDGKTFTLALSGPLPGPANGLRVMIGGVPVDAAGQPRTPGGSDSTAEPNTAARTPESQRSSIDPGVPGSFQTTTSEYSLPGVQLTGLPHEVEVQGVVVRPTTLVGSRPLVLFLHGRHTTCYRGGPDGRASLQWPCPDNWQPIPSYRGYLDAQELLASQGYVTVSISANGINGQDFRVGDGGAQARSELVRHHLELFDQWSTVGGAPFGSALVGHVDLDRVMLVGHSRGGEGVNRAAVDSTPSDPWRIDSQVLIGPTAFGRQTAPGVDSEVLLPFCDGDVSDLQGQQYIDQARDLFGNTTEPALRSAVLVMGANHNYFNKEWTPGDAVAPAGDDWGGRSGYCGKKAPTRLTPEEQRNVGAVYVASAARAFVKDDSKALALLDGTDVRPPSIGDAAVSVTALGANRTRALSFTAHTPIRSVNAFALVCRAYRVSKGQPTCAPSVRPWAQPHFLRMYEASDAPPSSALRMRWRQQGAKVNVPLPDPVDLSDSSSLDLRVAVHPGSGRAQLGVVIGDGSGHVQRLSAPSLYPLPGDDDLAKLWGQTVRLPLAQASQVDLSNVQWIRFVGDSGQGRVVILDAYGRSPGISSAPRPTLPRVDVEDVTVVEGDQGPHLEDVTLKVTGPLTGGERLYIETSSFGRDAADIKSVLRIRPGQSTITVPFPVSGDTRDDYRLRSSVALKALSGVITGDYLGTITTHDDDPAPNVVIKAPAVSVTEGDPLQWVVELDHRSDKGIGFAIKPTASGDNELTVADLPDRFVRRNNLKSYPPETKLSDTRLRLFNYVRPGRLATGFMLPTRADEVVEVPETVTLQQTRGADRPMPSNLFGTVSDQVS